MLFVEDRLLGEKNGQRFGRRSNIAVSVAEGIKTKKRPRKSIARSFKLRLWVFLLTFYEFTIFVNFFFDECSFDVVILPSPVFLVIFVIA